MDTWYNWTSTIQMGSNKMQQDIIGEAPTPLILFISLHRSNESVAYIWAIFADNYNPLLYIFKLWNSHSISENIPVVAVFQVTAAARGLLPQKQKILQETLVLGDPCPVWAPGSRDAIQDDSVEKWRKMIWEYFFLKLVCWLHSIFKLKLFT